MFLKVTLTCKKAARQKNTKSDKLHCSFISILPCYIRESSSQCVDFSRTSDTVNIAPVPGGAHKPVGKTKNTG